MSSRRSFLVKAPLGLAGLAAACRPGATPDTPGQPQGAGAPAGAPPTFGTMPATGPEVSAATFAEAEKLMQVTLAPADRAMAASSWKTSMAAMYERRTGPRTVPLGDADLPATLWQPHVVARAALPAAGAFAPPAVSAGPLPASDAAIAMAPVTHLSAWLRARQLTSERLVRIYLARIAQFDGRLKSVITLVAEPALAAAREADREIAAGKWRGPLHGIPYGVKDLLDTAGIATTWGAEPFRDRVPAADAPVVARLRAAGAILLAKLSLGALALNDIWFGGQTVNPWLPEEGASGSSAGPGAATAAGLVAFSIGSETGGSIISPSMRCGVTGLRPTFGRVPRTGAMTLCWSLDKLGPMTRSVADAMLVLHAIHGPDAGDPACVAAPLAWDGAAAARGLKVGVFRKWMTENPATAVDRAAVDALPALGMTAVDVSLPDWPYQSLNVVLFAEAAAAFEALTLSGKDHQLKAQVADAWPNLFREARFLSAVDFVQADRLRRKVAAEMARLFREVDLLLVPSLRDEMLTVGNFTGHPSLTLRTGFVEVAQARSDWAPDPAHPLPRFTPPRRVPHGVTLLGRLFDEGTVARAGLALERHFNVAGEAPPGYGA